MLTRAGGRSSKTALALGCSEGRFCRMLKEYGIRAAGIRHFDEPARQVVIRLEPSAIAALPGALLMDLQPAVP